MAFVDVVSTVSIIKISINGQNTATSNAMPIWTGSLLSNLGPGTTKRQL